MIYHQLSQTISSPKRYLQSHYNIMSERENSETVGRREKKNQKNIYVHKIKSLMRISQDNLGQDEKDISVAINK